MFGGIEIADFVEQVAFDSLDSIYSMGFESGAKELVIAKLGIVAVAE